MHWLTIQPKTLSVDNYLIYAIEKIVINKLFKKVASKKFFEVINDLD